MQHPPVWSRRSQKPCFRKKGKPENRLRYKCQECDITVTGLTVYESHLKGERHKKKMKQKALLADMIALRDYSKQVANREINRRLLRANMGYPDIASDDEQVEEVEEAEEIEEIEEVVEAIETIESVEPVEPVESVAAVKVIEAVEPVESVAAVKVIEAIKTVEPVESVEAVKVEMEPQAIAEGGAAVKKENVLDEVWVID